MKILVTGFDPFDAESKNPSIEAVKQLPPTIDGVKIMQLELPTVFHKSADVLLTQIENEKPSYILHIGQAGGRSEMTSERLAINVDDARIPDNEGNQPIDVLMCRSFLEAMPLILANCQ